MGLCEEIEWVLSLHPQAAQLPIGVACKTGPHAFGGDVFVFREEPDAGQ